VTLYYQDDRVTLYHADCLEMDAWTFADVLVTDPPYGIDWKQGDYNGSGRRSDDRVHAGIQKDGDTAARDAALAWWGSQRASAVFGSFRAPPPVGVVQTLVWRKPVDSGLVGSTTGYRTDTELIYLRGPQIARKASRSSVLESRSGMARYRSGHPHAKPPAILEMVIEWLPEGVVADPFAGSGSTLIAARNLGRRAVGVEIEERYCELIARRLDQGCLDFGEGA
jgi:DNA modification methylase